MIPVSVDELRDSLSPGQKWNWLMGGIATIRSVSTKFAEVSVTWPDRPSAGFTGRRSFKKLRQLLITKREEKPMELWEADPNCSHGVVDAPGGGVKCTKCPGWMCL